MTFQTGSESGSGWTKKEQQLFSEAMNKDRLEHILISFLKHQR